MSRLAGLLWPPLSAGRSSIHQSAARDGASLFRDHLGPAHHQLECLGDLESQGPRAANARPRHAVLHRLPARCARRVDGNFAADAFDRHRSPTGGPHHLGLAVVAVVDARTAGIEPARTAIEKICPRGRSRVAAANLPRRLDQHQLRGRGLPGFADLPAVLVAAHGFSRRLRAVARADSTTPAACSRIPRASPFT